MTNEEFLLKVLHTAIQNILIKLECAKNIPEEYTIPGFDDGKIVGLTLSLESLQQGLSLYKCRLQEQNDLTT